MHRKLILAVTATCMLLAGNVNAQPTMTKLAEGVYSFFSDWTNSLVVIGDDSVLVVDTAGTTRAEELKVAVADLTDKPVSHIVLTHEHYDHVGGTEVFEGAEVVCHVTCEKIFALDVFGFAPQVTQSYEDELNIDIGGVVVELKHLGTGDGVATTVIYVPSAQVVMTADLYGPNYLTEGAWLEDKNYLGTRKILNEIATWPLKHAISGHDESTDPQALIDNAAYLNDLYDAVKAELDKAMASGGAGAAFDLITGDLPTAVKLPQYAEWDGYQEHLPKHVWRMGMSIMHGG